MKLQDDVTSQMTEIQRLKGRVSSSAAHQGATARCSELQLSPMINSEGVFVIMSKTEQLTELKKELMKKEDQLREVKKNSTNLEKKLEYER